MLFEHLRMSSYSVLKISRLRKKGLETWQGIFLILSSRWCMRAVERGIVTELVEIAYFMLEEVLC